MKIANESLAKQFWNLNPTMTVMSLQELKLKKSLKHSQKIIKCLNDWKNEDKQLLLGGNNRVYLLDPRRVWNLATSFVIYILNACHTTLQAQTGQLSLRESVSLVYYPLSEGQDFSRLNNYNKNIINIT